MSVAGAWNALVGSSGSPAVVGAREVGWALPQPQEWEWRWSGAPKENWGTGIKRWGNGYLAGRVSVLKSRLQVSESCGASPGGQECKAALLSFWFMSHIVLRKSWTRTSVCCHVSPYLWEGIEGTQRTRIQRWVVSFGEHSRNKATRWRLWLIQGRKTVWEMP